MIAQREPVLPGNSVSCYELGFSVPVELISIVLDMAEPRPRRGHVAMVKTRSTATMGFSTWMCSSPGRRLFRPQGPDIRMAAWAGSLRWPRFFRPGGRLANR
jgi:hypothetical protein